MYQNWTPVKSVRSDEQNFTEMVRCDKINKSYLSYAAMDDAVQEFAEYLGLSGTDVDLFYESYYNMNYDENDYDSVFEEQNESFI